MAVTAPDLRKKSDAELWELLHSDEVDSPTHRQCLVMLEMRNIEKQLRAATEQARAAADQAIVSHGMVAATRGLVAFARGLVRATWALFAVAAAILILTVVQVLIATKVIGPCLPRSGARWSQTASRRSQCTLQAEHSSHATLHRTPFSVTSRMLPASPSHTRCSAKYASKLRTRSAMEGESFVAAARLIPLDPQGVRCAPPGTNATSDLRQLSAKASIIAPETEAGPGEWGAPTRRRHSRSHRSNPWLIAATTLSLLIRARASHCSTICRWASPPSLGSFSSAFITADSASV